MRIAREEEIFCLNCYGEDRWIAWTVRGTFEAQGGILYDFTPDEEEAAICPRCGSDDWADR